MRGGKPGFYPSLKEAKGIPHPIPFDLYDPFGLFANDSAEKKAGRSRRDRAQIAPRSRPQIASRPLPVLVGGMLPP